MATPKSINVNVHIADLQRVKDERAALSAERDAYRDLLAKIAEASELTPESAYDGGWISMGHHYLNAEDFALVRSLAAELLRSLVSPDEEGGA